jgi:hypothetical protein
MNILLIFSCRYYIGSREGEQGACFLRAFHRVEKHFARQDVEVKSESLEAHQMRKDGGWTLSAIVDWLLTSHIHFVLTHPHQGLHATGWSANAIHQEFRRLTYHPGFPSGEKFGCAVYTQDKWKYLQQLPSTFIMPTYKIPMTADMDMDGCESDLKRYCSDNKTRTNITNNM